MMLAVTEDAGRSEDAVKDAGSSRGRFTLRGRYRGRWQLKSTLHAAEDATEDAGHETKCLKGLWTLERTLDIRQNVRLQAARCRKR